MTCTMPCAQHASADFSSSWTIACAACQSPSSRSPIALASSSSLISIDLCAGSLHDLVPLFRLRCDELRKVLGGVGDHAQAQCLQASGHACIAQRLCEFRIQ